MAADEFIAAALNKISESDIPVYKIDVSDYTNKNAFLEAIKSRYGNSFERICLSLNNGQRACLIFDEVPTRLSANIGGSTPELVLEDLSKIALQQCPDLVIILRSRLPPLTNEFRSIQLKEFDEADLKSYVASYGDRFSEILSEQSIRALHRLTDGVPSRVDKALDQLRVAPLSELVSHSNELLIYRNQEVASNSHTALGEAIKAMATSTDPNTIRNFEFLKLLSVFPKGEQLVRIKRFYVTRGFFINNAMDLLDDEYIVSNITQPIGKSVGKEAIRTLSVPPLVKGEVVKYISPVEFQKFHRRIAEIYFGEDWLNGILKSSYLYPFEDPHCSSSDLHNANTVITRIMIFAQETAEERDLNSAMGLVITYSFALMAGDHFGHVVSLLEDILKMVPSNGYEERVSQIQMLYARGLRMLGEHKQSIAIYSELNLHKLSNDNHQSALLGMLLCYKSLEDSFSVEKTLGQITELGRKTSSALMAKSVALQLQPESVERDKKLRVLERQCRSRGFVTVANEIALDRVEKKGMSADEIIKELIPVVSSTSNKEGFYIRLRAYLRLARISLDERGELADVEAELMMLAYEYLFNERLANLFDKAHDMLWSHFENKGDIENLLRLFRHSSLYWQVRGYEIREHRYIAKGEKLFGSPGPYGSDRASSNLAYFHMRMALFNDGSKKIH